MLSICLLLGLSVAAGGDERVAPRVADRVQPASPGAVVIKGWLGDRIDCNRTGRLEHAPIEELLAGFKHRPGSHPWIGEHIGKWLHAAALAWEYSRDPQLKAMMDKAVRDLLATQKDDGYLGTYVDAERWTSWDVWVHKYDLIGLLAYYRATGDEAALRGASRIGDLLVATFGPGKRDIIASGTHVGMAATSVLEPMVLLYRATGEGRYLAFCKYLVESWDQPNGPKILSSLLDHGKVNKTANGKAYEMMSNLVGLCELYRVTGDDRYLKAAKAAWDDVAANQVYLVGGTSLGEHFQPDGHLPDVGTIAETCADVTWMQLSTQLLRITGEAKYADAIEQLVYNHLIGAQAADGNDWCYFTPLRGRKQFLDFVNCCHSSGPRGVAMIPEVIYGTTPRGIRINLFADSTFRTDVPGAGMVEVTQQTTYPAELGLRIRVKLAKPARFTLEIRLPSWSPDTLIAVDSKAVDPPPNDILSIDREWRSGDQVAIVLRDLQQRSDVGPRVIRGTGEHAGMLAVQRGPMVLCASARWNPDSLHVGMVGADEITFEALDSVAGIAPAEKPYLTAVKMKQRTAAGLSDVKVVLGPFAFVQDEPFVVWFPSPAALLKADYSLLYWGHEAYSRRGNLKASIADGEPTSFRSTFGGDSADRDWYQVTLDQPAEIRRIVFRHGHTSNNGGWFDTSKGKPEVYVQKQKDGPWEPVGKLESYPDTTADKRPVIPDGQPFELSIAATEVFGVRVEGKPACGDKPEQAFSTCAELEAYAR